jgi:hypothetical protein
MVASARFSSLALILLFATAAPVQSAPLSKFDGRWSILVATDRGDCSRAYRYAVIVNNGQARYGGSEDFTVAGSIASDGTVRASISRGTDRADVHGRLGAGVGSGRWSVSGTYACSGHWTAERRAAEL